MAEAGTRIEPGAVDGKTGPDGLYLGDAIDFFLNAKHAGGRSERTIDDYRKKLEPRRAGPSKWISCTST